MTTKKTANLDMRIEPELLERIDAWRATLRVPPSRTAAVVHMIKKFLASEPKPKVRIGKNVRRDYEAQKADEARTRVQWPGRFAPPNRLTQRTRSNQ
jgi:hypothetical protein